MPQPPKHAHKFLRWFCREDYLEEIEGDLLELFEDLGKNNPHRARRAFTWQVIRHFHPAFIKPFSIPYLIYFPMIQHNLLITYRSFLRNKSTFLINLIGLSMGLAAAILIYTWITSELQVDTFHENDDRLYQVMQNYHGNSEGIMTFSYSPVQLTDAFLDEIPEVEHAACMNNRYYFTEKGIVSDEQKEIQIQAKGICASEDFFHVFSYPLIQGNVGNVLSDKKAVVISEGLANKVFGTSQNIVGKTLEWEQKDFSGSFLVSGVFENPPTNSSIQFELVFPIEVLLDNTIETREWYTDAVETFVVLREGINVDQVNEKIENYLKPKHRFREQSTLFLQQFSQRHLYGQYEAGKVSGGRILYVQLFSLIALFLLIMACVNFINLSTAKASVRQKEVGVKKATGATRKDLVFQFLSESLLMTFISSIVAFILVAIFLPQFNTITGTNIHLNFTYFGPLTLIGFILLTGLIAGSYPALYLSRYSPVSILKQKGSFSSGETWIRKGLVVFQFTLSVIFIIAVLIIHQQISFIQKKNLGYSKENVISFVSKGITSEKVETFMTQVRNVPGIISATNIYGGSFLKNTNFGVAPNWEGQDPNLELNVPRPHVGYDYLKTLGIELKEGRSFSRAYTNERRKVIINEAAAAVIGYENPIGKILTRGTDNPLELEIIGVVEDFHNESLHTAIKPTFIRFLAEGKDIMVKLQADEQGTTLKKLTEIYEAFHPGFPFEFSFMDQEYQLLYEAEARVAVLSKYASFIAILISCLGLLGLAAFTASRRKKEMGIRKVLGATVSQLVQILTADFSKMVLASIVVAIPISYLIAHNWLENFAYSIALQGWFFVVPAVATLLIAWITVSVQTLSVARVNPVECLKDE